MIINLLEKVVVDVKRITYDCGVEKEYNIIMVCYIMIPTKYMKCLTFQIQCDTMMV